MKLSKSYETLQVYFWGYFWFPNEVLKLIKDSILCGILNTACTTKDFVVSYLYILIFRELGDSNLSFIFWGNKIDFLRILQNFVSLKNIEISIFDDFVNVRKWNCQNPIGYFKYIFVVTFDA